MSSQMITASVDHRSSAVLRVHPISDSAPHIHRANSRCRRRSCRDSSRRWSDTARRGPRSRVATCTKPTLFGAASSVRGARPADRHTGAGATIACAVTRTVTAITIVRAGTARRLTFLGPAGAVTVATSTLPGCALPLVKAIARAVVPDTDARPIAAIEIRLTRCARAAQLAARHVQNPINPLLEDEPHTLGASGNHTDWIHKGAVSSGLFGAGQGTAQVPVFLRPDAPTQLLLQHWLFFLHGLPLRLAAAALAARPPSARAPAAAIPTRPCRACRRDRAWRKAAPDHQNALNSCVFPPGRGRHRRAHAPRHAGGPAGHHPVAGPMEPDRYHPRRAIGPGVGQSGRRR